MKCPECLTEGKTSTVIVSGGYNTAMHYPAFYDADGRLHDHNANVTTEVCHCSNGHAWKHKLKRPACWCGWEGN